MSTLVSLNQPTNTYLELCEKELDPALIDRYTKESNSFANSALVRAVAYPLFVIASLATAAIIAPIFTIVIGFSSVMLLFHVKKAYSSLILKSELAHERANQLNAIQAHHLTLANSTPAQIQQMLKDKGLSFIIGMIPNDPKLISLKPALARHLYWEDRIAELKSLQDEKLVRAGSLTKQNFELNRNEIFAAQSQALEFEKQALNAKVKCAFVNAVLFNPTYKGNLENLGRFSILSGEERAIAVPSGVAKANDFFQFNRPNAPAITYDEAKCNTIPQLAMHLYRNMHP